MASTLAQGLLPIKYVSFGHLDVASRFGGKKVVYMARVTNLFARRPIASMDALLNRIIGEYLEMPGLSLSLAQAQRLWQLDEATCRRMLGILVDRAFLKQTDRGTYVMTAAGS